MSEGKYLIKGAIAPSMIGEVAAGGPDAGKSGAVSVFAGRVRADSVDGRDVETIEYSCYEKMLVEAVDSIKRDIHSRYPDVMSVTILHSDGMVRAGEISLLVVVTGGHRKQAMEACSMAVEMVKQRLPVWKKEIFADGGWRWI